MLTKRDVECFVTDPDIDEFTSSVWKAQPKQHAQPNKYGFNYADKKREMEISQKIARIYNSKRPIDQKVNGIIQARDARNKQYINSLSQTAARSRPDKHSDFNRTFLRVEGISKLFEYVCKRRKNQ